MKDTVFEKGELEKLVKEELDRTNPYSPPGRPYSL
jgi:hypothetical protein